MNDSNNIIYGMKYDKSSRVVPKAIKNHIDQLTSGKH
jgi:hypothetical protein